MTASQMTPNQCVAWNLRRARERCGWTQEQAAEHLEPHIGARWSKAAFSAAERSVAGERVRHFSADDLLAFSRTFGLPITYFLRPPSWVEEIGHPDSNETVPRDGSISETSGATYLDLLFDVGEDAHEWLLLEVVPMAAQTMRPLRRWGKHFAAMVAHREREAAAFVADAREREEQS